MRLVLKDETLRWDKIEEEFKDNWAEYRLHSILNTSTTFRKRINKTASTYINKNGSF